jgi:hypothetical protein
MNTGIQIKITPIRSVILNEHRMAYFPGRGDYLRLSEVDADLMAGNAIRAKVIVQKIVVLTDDDYQFVAATLRHDYPALWENIGGSTCDESFLIGLEPRTTDWYLAWARNCEQYVVMVANESTGENFVVNCENFDHARYVGRTDNWYAINTTKNIIKKYGVVS